MLNNPEYPDEEKGHPVWGLLCVAAVVGWFFLAKGITDNARKDRGERRTTWKEFLFPPRQ